MNDCLWCALDVCECDGKCSKYLSMNEEDGEILMTQWLSKVDEVLEPLRKEFAKENDFFEGVDNDK